MNREKTMKKSFKDCKFSFTKNFLYFLIAPALILLVGIILCTTVGFNLGTDFKNGVTFKVYANYENAIDNSSDSKNYDLSNENDYQEIKDKIALVLNENGLKIVSFRTTSMNIKDYGVYGGQAVEVVYQNSGASTDEVREMLVHEFGYDGYDKAVTSFDEIQSSYTFNYVAGIVAAIVFALISAIIYLSLKFDKTAMIVSILQVALDLFLVLGLLAITRVKVNLSVAATILTAFLLSLVNLIYFYINMKTSIKQGKFEKVRPAEMADTLTKELTCKKSFVYLIVLVVFILLAAFVGGGVREVSLGIIISLVVTYYTSQTLLPSFWATIRSVKKKKKI